MGVLSVSMPFGVCIPRNARSSARSSAPIQLGSCRSQAAMARPISAPESSWRKWMPGTVTSAWSGQVRQKFRTAPVRMLPGSALTNSLGSLGAEASQAA